MTAISLASGEVGTSRSTATASSWPSRSSPRSSCSGAGVPAQPCRGPPEHAPSGCWARIGAGAPLVATPWESVQGARSASSGSGKRPDALRGYVLAHPRRILFVPPREAPGWAVADPPRRRWRWGRIRAASGCFLNGLSTAFRLSSPGESVFRLVLSSAGVSGGHSSSQVLMSLSGFALRSSSARPEKHAARRCLFWSSSRWTAGLRFVIDFPRYLRRDLLRADREPSFNMNQLLSGSDATALIMLRGLEEPLHADGAGGLPPRRPRDPGPQSTPAGRARGSAGLTQGSTTRRTEGSARSFALSCGHPVHHCLSPACRAASSGGHRRLYVASTFPRAPGAQAGGASRAGAGV